MLNVIDMFLKYKQLIWLFVSVRLLLHMDLIVEILFSATMNQQFKGTYMPLQMNNSFQGQHYQIHEENTVHGKISGTASKISFEMMITTMACAL